MSNEMNEYIKDKRRKGLCEHFGCYGRAEYWYKLGDAHKRYVCAKCFHEDDSLLERIAKITGMSYTKGRLVVLHGQRKITSHTGGDDDGEGENAVDVS